jgi:hypothetical protein
MTIKEKIKKLKEHAQSAESAGSTEEAKAFASKAIELSMEHEVNYETIENDDNEFVSVEYPVSNFQTTQDGEFAPILANILSDYCLCGCIKKSGKSGKAILFIGTPERVDRFILITQSLSQQLLDAVKKSWKRNAKEMGIPYGNYRKNFLYGACSEIDVRIKELMSEMNKDHDNKPKDIVLASKYKVNEWIFQNFNIRKGRRLQVNNAFAYKQGKEAGKNVSIFKDGLDNKSSSKRLQSG